MLGGAWVTNGTEILPYYRNWFRRNFYQHAGFRIARDSAREKKTVFLKKPVFWN